jgi:hypothetical protein
MPNFVEMRYEIDEYELAATVETHKNQGHEGVYVDHDITTPSQVDSARNVWVRWVKNASGGALLPGVVCKAVLTSAATSKYHVDVCGASDKPVGVVNRHHLAAGVPDGYYFYMVVEGPTEVIDSGSAVSAGDTIAAAASGDVATASSPPTEFDLGTALEAGAANATFQASINCRGNS